MYPSYAFQVTSEGLISSCFHVPTLKREDILEVQPSLTIHDHYYEEILATIITTALSLDCTLHINIIYHNNNKEAVVS